MRPYFLLLVAVLLAITDTLTTESNQLRPADQSIGPLKTRRSLRLAKKSDTSNEKEDATDGKERLGLSSLKAEIKKIPLKVKLAWWQHFVGKPSEYVKKKLGANHPLYLKYRYTREGLEMWDLASDSYSTYKIWKREGLDRMITLHNGMTLDQIALQIKKLEGTEPFRVYKRYAEEFDGHRISSFELGGYRDTYFIDESASVAERYVRAHIWAKSKIYEEYVLEFLGLLDMKPILIQHNPYYQYYLKMLASQ